MIAKFDHRPMLTAALALATTVLLVVVVTLSILLLTAPPAVAPPTSVGDNPPVMGAGGEFYGDGWNNYGNDRDQAKPAQTGNGADLSAVDRRHAAMVEAYNDKR